MPRNVLKITKHFNKDIVLTTYRNTVRQNVKKIKRVFRKTLASTAR
jgi:hypothetical protein